MRMAPKARMVAREVRELHISVRTQHISTKNHLPFLPLCLTHRVCSERQPSVSLILGTLLWFSPAQFVDSVPKKTTDNTSFLLIHAPFSLGTTLSFLLCFLSQLSPETAKN